MSVSHESFSTAAGPVPVDVYSPTPTGKYPGVLILHGTLGLEPPFGPEIVSFAEALSSNGVAGMIPQYFESTHTAAGDDAIKSLTENLHAWKSACGAALSFMAADRRVDATHVGLLGFSLGGHIALSLAMGRPAGMNLKGVVDFFGPTVQVPLNGDWSALPPVLIHHGTLDPLPIANSEHVVTELAAKGRKIVPEIFGTPPMGPKTDDQFVKYPGEGHGFKGAALAGSRDKTVDFLTKELKS